jgi:hypothetical protein
MIWPDGLEFARGASPSSVTTRLQGLSVDILLESQDSKGNVVRLAYATASLDRRLRRVHRRLSLRGFEAVENL